MSREIISENRTYGLLHLRTSGPMDYQADPDISISKQAVFIMEHSKELVLKHIHTSVSSSLTSSKIYFIWPIIPRWSYIPSQSIILIWVVNSQMILHSLPVNNSHLGCHFSDFSMYGHTSSPGHTKIFNWLLVLTWSFPFSK